MGNTCCSNEAIKEQGDVQTKIELKKPLSKRDVKFTPDTTAPNSQQYQQTPQNVEKWSLDGEYKRFLQTLRSIRTKINETVNEQKSLLTKRNWQQSFEFFDKYYLTLQDRHQLSNLLYKMLKVEFCRPFNQKQIQQQFLEKIDEKDMSEELGYKLKSLKQRIESRKSQALEYLSFLKEFSSYKTDFSDIKKIARRVHQFCQKDINAFSFITLYLINCINVQLSTNPSSIFEIIDKLKKILKDLSVEYPPSSMEIQEQSDHSEKDLFNQSQAIQVNYETCIRYPTIKLTQKNFESKLLQVQDYIIKKARQAKKNKITFQQILRPVCMKRGNHFQSAVKIKSCSNQEILSIIRTIEKVVFKGNEEECLKQLQIMKQEIITQISQFQDFNKLGKFCQKWSQSIEYAEKRILQDKSYVPFNVCDLLRGKAMFKSRADISKTVKDIQSTLQKWPKDKYKILQTQDRLQTPTKDYKMLIQIDETIAQLQLCKQMNKASNEFNHKIYELKRSKAFTPLFNLTIINESLTEIFFTDLLEFLFFMIYCQEPEFINGQGQLRKFTSDYLAKNVKAFQEGGDEEEAQNRLFTKDQATLRQETSQRLQQIKQMLKIGYSMNGYYERDDIRKGNAQHFMK